MPTTIARLPLSDRQQAADIFRDNLEYEDKGSIGINKQGDVLLYSGRLCRLLHPMQSKRVDQLLRSMNGGQLSSLNRLPTTKQIKRALALIPQPLDRASPQTRAAAPVQTKPVHSEVHPAEICQALEQRLASPLIALNSYAEVAGARFPSIGTACATLQTAPDGTPLPLNQISINQQGLGYAGQYPTAPHMGAYLEWILQTKPSVLVVISNEQDAERFKFPTPRYFEQAKQYADANGKPISVRTPKRGEMCIQQGGQSHTLKVLHIGDWVDKTAPTTQQLQAWAAQVQKFGGQPLIHCSAGIGRTGTLFTQIAMNKHADQSVEQIIQQLRQQRSPRMVQTPEQRTVLVESALNMGRQVLTPEEPVYENLPRQNELVYENFKANATRKTNQGRL